MVRHVLQSSLWFVVDPNFQLVLLLDDAMILILALRFTLDDGIEFVKIRLQKKGSMVRIIPPVHSGWRRLSNFQVESVLILFPSPFFLIYFFLIIIIILDWEGCEELHIVNNKNLCATKVALGTAFCLRQSKPCHLIALVFGRLRFGCILKKLCF